MNCFLLQEMARPGQEHRSLDLSLWWVSLGHGGTIFPLFFQLLCVWLDATKSHTAAPCYRDICVPVLGGMLWEQQNLSALSPAEYNSQEQAGPLFRLGKITL